MNPEHDKRQDPDAQVDPTTTTGAYRVLVKKEYGRRRHPRQDKPLWWVLVYHLVRSFVGTFPILAYLAVALLFRECGINLPGAP